MAPVWCSVSMCPCVAQHWCETFSQYHIGQNSIYRMPILTVTLFLESPWRRPVEVLSIMGTVLSIISLDPFAHETLTTPVIMLMTWVYRRALLNSKACSLIYVPKCIKTIINHSNSEEYVKTIPDCTLITPFILFHHNIKAYRKEQLTFNLGLYWSLYRIIYCLFFE